MIARKVLDLAATQFGVVSRTQLVGPFDIPPWKIARLQRAGMLVEILPGVVRFASSPETFLMRCMAVQLRSEQRGFLSGWTAAKLGQLRAMPEQPIHFTVPLNPRHKYPKWVEAHRTRWYDAELDRQELPSGLIVASPMRMLFGLAAAFNQFRFERAAEDAWHRKLLTPDSVAEYLSKHRCRGKDGVATIERWLEKALQQNRPSQSDLERVLLAALDDALLPTPVRQHPLTLPTGETIHLDIAWPRIRLAVEPGASWWHGGDLAQRLDQARDRACSELGWMIVRFDESMRSDVADAAHQIRQIYRRRIEDFRNMS